MALSAIETLDTLPRYDLDAEAAIALLEEEGYTLDENGEAFEAGTDAVRYKKAEDGSLQKLQLNWAALSDNTGCATLYDYTLDNLKNAGFEVNVEEMGFVEMTDIYYRHTQRTHNMFYLASNFDLVYDPYYAFHSDAEYQGVRNTTGIADEKLMELAEDLRMTEVGANDVYLEKWIELQKYYAEIIPTYPLYSNVYFDIYDEWVVDYNPNIYHTWATAIVYADLVDPALQVVEEELVLEDEEIETDDEELVEIF